MSCKSEPPRTPPGSHPDLRQLTRSEVEEIRRLGLTANPPPSVRRCLEVVYITLNASQLVDRINGLASGAPLRIDWRAVQQMLVKFQTLLPAMLSFDIGPLVASEAVRDYLHRTYFVGDGALTEKRVGRSSAVCAVFFRWYLGCMRRVQVVVSPATADKPTGDVEDQARKRAASAHEELQRRLGSLAVEEASGRCECDAEEGSAWQAMMLLLEAQEKARREMEVRLGMEAHERAKREAEEKAKREAAERAKREAEEKAKREAAERAKREAEEKAKREAAERAKREAEEKAKRQAEPPPPGEPPRTKIPTTGALQELPPKVDVKDPQQTLLLALTGTQAAAPPPKKTGPCDKCDGPHHADDCPYYKKPREKHADAWSNYGKKGDAKAKGSGAAVVLRGATVVRQPGDGSCLFHSLSHGLRGTTAPALRKDIATYVMNHSDAPIAGTPLKDWVLWDSGLSPKDYGLRMGTGNHWGGAIELAVCARLKRVTVHVYEQVRGQFVRISTFESSSPPEDTIHLLYGGRVHYDALKVGAH